ncbi:DNA cytosine methyltransferase [Desulfobacter postgatei]|uniref:DNA cytosine methyltransferase n=1 Tax=Desulfobacter postgatei TaxID=2293 RepID=UPI003A5226B9
MRHLDLFSGIGGFALAASWVWPASLPVAFFEINKQCQDVLRKHWPSVPIKGDVRQYDGDTADIICGGDPCPIRSKARSIWRPGKCSDYSGYFLAVVQRCGARWVLRENVPASDDKDFCAALELLGYRTVIIRTNSYPFTAQNRTRDIVVGCNKTALADQFRFSFERQGSNGLDCQKHKKEEGYPCLTTHPCRYDARDGYIWDGSGRLRTADKDERTKLAGFPAGWLDGLSKTAVARVTGNAVVPQVVEQIFRVIKEVEA